MSEVIAENRKFRLENLRLKMQLTLEQEKTKRFEMQSHRSENSEIKGCSDKILDNLSSSTVKKNTHLKDAFF
jgi:regulator of replication initiation timing